MEFVLDRVEHRLVLFDDSLVLVVFFRWEAEGTRRSKVEDVCVWILLVGLRLVSMKNIGCMETLTPMPSSIKGSIPTLIKYASVVDMLFSGALA